MFHIHSSSVHFPEDLDKDDLKNLKEKLFEALKDYLYGIEGSKDKIDELKLKIQNLKTKINMLEK